MHRVSPVCAAGGGQGSAAVGLPGRVADHGAIRQSGDAAAVRGVQQGTRRRTVPRLVRRLRAVCRPRRDRPPVHHWISAPDSRQSRTPASSAGRLSARLARTGLRGGAGTSERSARQDGPQARFLSRAPPRADCTAGIVYSGGARSARLSCCPRSAAGAL